MEKMMPGIIAPERDRSEADAEDDDGDGCHDFYGSEAYAVATVVRCCSCRRGETKPGFRCRGGTTGAHHWPVTSGT